VWSALGEAQRALPLAPPPQQAPLRRRRVCRGYKGHLAVAGRRRFCRMGPAPPEPPAVWRPWDEAYGDRCSPFRGFRDNVLARMQLWGQLLHMPTLLQRDKPALQWEVVTSEELAQGRRLGPGDI
jgi:hypothetical protein